jgi:hypothetical protein
MAKRVEFLVLIARLFFFFWVQRNKNNIKSIVAQSTLLDISNEDIRCSNVSPPTVELKKKKDIPPHE